MATVYLDAVLEPPRSLSPAGFKLVMIVLGGFSAIFGLVFLISGAWPITGFFGLEMFALWLVFRTSFAAQRARTYVRVTAETVDLKKVDGQGRERLARLPALFTRVELDQKASGAHALRVRASQRAYALGEHLTPDERKSFAKRLDQALWQARRERYEGEER